MSACRASSSRGLDQQQAKTHLESIPTRRDRLCSSQCSQAMAGRLASYTTSSSSRRRPLTPCGRARGGHPGVSQCRGCRPRDEAGHTMLSELCQASNESGVEGGSECWAAGRVGEGDSEGGTIGRRAWRVAPSRLQVAPPPAEAGQLSTAQQAGATSRTNLVRGLAACELGVESARAASGRSGAPAAKRGASRVVPRPSCFPAGEPPTASPRPSDYCMAFDSDDVQVHLSPNPHAVRPRPSFRGRRTVGWQR